MRSPDELWEGPNWEGPNCLSFTVVIHEAFRQVARHPPATGPPAGAMARRNARAPELLESVAIYALGAPENELQDSWEVSACSPAAHACLDSVKN